MDRFDRNGLGTACPAPGACETVEAIAEGKCTAREALESCLETLEAANASVNAVTSTDLSAARAAADKTDKRMAAGAEPRALEGLPMTIKEVFDLEGFASSWGDPALSGNYPDCDSGVARLLKKAGAMIFGKTNIPERMADWETDNRQWGATRNPWDLDRSAGGSSGGSAAAVAAGITPVCIGSDMGGSIRMPAHYCGVFGLKPSWNVIPMTGHSLSGEVRAPDMCVAGPIARKPEDLSLLLNALAQADRAPGTAAPAAAAPKPLPELRLGCLLNSADCPVDVPYHDALIRFVDNLEAAGVTVDAGALPAFDFTRATEVMNLLARAETSTMLGGEDFGAALARITAPGHAGQNARGATLLHRDWLRLHEERLRYRQNWDDYFRRYDGFLCPVAAGCAQPLVTGINSPLERTVEVNGNLIDLTDQHFWAAVPTLPGLPAVALPIGMSAEGLPAGIQLVGPAFQDHTVIALAGLLNQSAPDETGRCGNRNFQTPAPAR